MPPTMSSPGAFIKFKIKAGLLYGSLSNLTNVILHAIIWWLMTRSVEDKPTIDGDCTGKAENKPAPKPIPITGGLRSFIEAHPELLAELSRPLHPPALPSMPTVAAEPDSENSPTEPAIDDVFSRPITHLSAPAIKIFLDQHPTTELYVTDSHGLLSDDPASSDGKLFLHKSSGYITLQVKIGPDFVALDFAENGNRFTLTPASATKIRLVRAMEEVGKSEARGRGTSSYLAEYSATHRARTHEKSVEEFSTMLATAFAGSQTVSINGNRNTVVFELDPVDVEKLKNEASSCFNVLVSNRLSITSTQSWEIGGDEISRVIRDAMNSAGCGGKCAALIDHDSHTVGPYAIVFSPWIGKVFILSKHRYLGQ